MCPLFIPLSWSVKQNSFSNLIESGFPFMLQQTFKWTQGCTIMYPSSETLVSFLCLNPDCIHLSCPITSNWCSVRFANLKDGCRLGRMSRGDKIKVLEEWVAAHSPCYGLFSDAAQYSRASAHQGSRLQPKGEMKLNVINGNVQKIKLCKM